MNQNLFTTLESWMTLLTSDTTMLGGQWIGLYQTIGAPLGPNLTMADLGECDFPGYARQHLGAWHGPYVDQANQVISDAPSMYFACSDTTTPNSVIGAFYGSASAAGTLKLVDPFPTPIGMASTADAFTYVPRVALDPAANYGGGVVVN